MILLRFAISDGKRDYNFCINNCLCVMVLTGQIALQCIQAISQGSFTAMVSKALINPASCGHTATQAPHFIQAFHPISNTTGSFFSCLNFFVFRVWTKITRHGFVQHFMQL